MTSNSVFSSSGSSFSDQLGSPAVEPVGEEREEGLLFAVSLKRTRYTSAYSQLQEGDGYLLWNTTKVRVVKAGTLQGLVWYLVPYQREPDASYRSCFLNTFRLFSSPREVLEMLADRHKAMAANRSEDTEQQAKRTVQIGVESFVRTWVERFPGDLESSPSCPFPRSLQAFLDECGAHSNHRTAGPTESTPALEASSRDGPFDLYTLTPEEFAEGITAEEARLFRELVPHQCLSYVRHMKTAHSPTVRRCIALSNRLSLLVIQSVLDREGGVEGRARALGHWIAVAQQCRKLKNFSSAMSIVCGMRSTAVFSLQQSWNSLPQNKQTTFMELAQLFSADSNHQISRDILSREGTGKHVALSPVSHRGKAAHDVQVVQGVVPFLGTFLSDLTMLHAAHKDKLEDGLINFDKCRKQFEVLVQLMLYQSAAENYSFPQSHRLLSWLYHTPVLSQQEGYELSQQFTEEHCTSASEGDSPNSSSTVSFFKSLWQRFNPWTLPSFSPLSPPPPSLPSSSPDSHRKHLSSRACYFVSQNSSSLSDQVSSSPCSSSASDKLIVRVYCSWDTSQYKSILVEESERAASVIRRALEKHGVENGNAHYSLVLLEGTRRTTIPDHSNVFYALSSLNDAALMLEHNSPQHSQN